MEINLLLLTQIKALSFTKYTQYQNKLRRLYEYSIDNNVTDVDERIHLTCRHLMRNIIISYKNVFFVGYVSRFIAFGQVFFLLLWLYE